MADPKPNQAPNSTVQSKPTGKNKPRILCKSIVFVLFLVAIPIFPSQAPNFISQSLITKFWELLHLVFIGLAVSYGLFSRRNVELDQFDVQSSVVVDDPQSSFVSRIFHVSPIFEDGYENASGFDEKNLYPNCNWNSNGGSFSEENTRIESMNSENGFEVSLGNEERNVIQAWNSQYFQGESMVVVSESNYELDESGKHDAQVVGYKSLGLPVRSLKSMIRELDDSQFSNGSESGSSLNGSERSSYEQGISDDMSPVNLESEFNGTAAAAALEAQMPWRSRSDRMEIRDNVDLGAAPSRRPLHFRPYSVDETQFESLKSRSFGSGTSFSSGVSSESDSPTRPSSVNSVSSELPASEMEELEKKNGFRASYPPVSQPSSAAAATKHREARLNAFHLRRYSSSGSLFQKDSRGRSKPELKTEFSRSRREDKDSLGSKEREKGSEKPIKASAKGKSVRTIRAAGGYAAESINGRERIKKYIDDECKALDVGEKEIERVGLDNISVGSSKNFDIESNIVPEPVSSKYEKRGKGKYFEDEVLKSKENSESEASKFHASSDEDAKTGHDPSEVDRKAGEFIAKFREQIRLQKVASIERSRGKNNNVNHFR